MKGAEFVIKNRNITPVQNDKVTDDINSFNVLGITGH